MEQKSHWVFDYIRYSDKKAKKEDEQLQLTYEDNDILMENEAQKEQKDIIYESNINKRNSNLDKSPGRQFLQYQNSTVKESPFTITFDSLKNSYQGKSFNLRGSERDLANLSYRDKDKDKSFNHNNNNNNSINLNEFSKNKDNNLYNYNTHYGSSSNFNINQTHLKKRNTYTNQYNTITNTDMPLNMNINEAEPATPKDLKRSTTDIPTPKKRVSFAAESNINYASGILSPCKENKSPLRLSKYSLKSNLKNDDLNKKMQRETETKVTKTNDDIVKSEIESEFEKIFEGLNLIDKHSSQTLNKFPSYMIDDLRLMILDLTHSVDQKKLEIEEILNKE